MTINETIVNIPVTHDFSELDKKIALPDKDGLNFYRIKKIIRCHSHNSYTEFYISDENCINRGNIKITVSKGFEHFEDILVSTGSFFRIHNQHIVNVNHIKKYVRTKGSYLIMDDITDEIIPVARARKVGFLNHLKMQGILV